MKISELFDVTGKVVVITGGSRGIGEIMARAFADNGARVYITARKADECRATAEDIAKSGFCVAIPGDLSTLDGIKSFVSEIQARESKVDVLINNAGAAWGATFAEFPESGWDKVMDINLKSPFFLTQQMLPLLEAAATDDMWARVIHVSSVDGMRIPPYETYSYISSKAALNHLTRMMAKHLAKRKILVNTIAPGLFPSKMSVAVTRDHSDFFYTSTPVARPGEPADMAGVVLFLASKASAYLCGAIIPVDGGNGATV